jgi:hypothetical protein
VDGGRCTTRERRRGGEGFKAKQLSIKISTETEKGGLEIAIRGSMNWILIENRRPDEVEDEIDVRC